MVLHDSTTVIETIISIPMQLIGGGDWTVTEYVGYGGRDVIAIVELLKYPEGLGEPDATPVAPPVDGADETVLLAE